MIPFRLLAITPPTGPVSPEIVESWSAHPAGHDLAVLLREPGRSPTDLLADHARLAPLRRACLARGIPVLLSLAPDHLDHLNHLAPSVFASLAGLHLRGDPNLATLTRLHRRLTPTQPVPSDSPLPRLTPTPVPSDSLLPRHLWLGRSCHGAPQPGHSLVDYTLFAPVFAPTTAQPGRPLGSKAPAGLSALRAWTRDPHALVLALGGVTVATAGACLAAGARGLAGIGVFFGDPEQVAQNVAALRDIVAAHDAHVEPFSPR